MPVNNTFKPAVKIQNVIAFLLIKTNKQKQSQVGNSAPFWNLAIEGIPSSPESLIGTLLSSPLFLKESD